jgi:hypothetical protein
VRSLFLVIACCASLVPAIGQPPQDPLDRYKIDLAGNPRSSEAHFRLGEAYLLENDFQSAANEFQKAAFVDPNARWTEVWAHINLGRVYDITGRCASDVNEYRAALRTRDDSFGAQAEIQDYLTTKIIRPVVRLPESADDSGVLPGVHRVGNDVVGPILLNKTDPEYSEGARLAGLEGTVLLKAVIALDGTATAPQTVNQWINTSCFTLPPAGTFDVGRNTLTGPGMVTVDTAVARVFSIKERMRLQLRGEAFNTANHPNFQQANGTQNSPLFGRITATLIDNREIQVALKLLF